jgi:hypothetical protein
VRGGAMEVVVRGGATEVGGVAGMEVEKEVGVARGGAGVDPGLSAVGVAAGKTLISKG